jgi:hypothetical protein
MNVRLCDSGRHLQAVTHVMQKAGCFSTIQDGLRDSIGSGD